MSKAWNKDMDKCHGNTDTNVVRFYLLLDMSKEQNGDTETNDIDSWDFIYYWRYPNYKMILFKSRHRNKCHGILFTIGGKKYIHEDKDINVL
jgi:hypothetical protein